MLVRPPLHSLVRDDPALTSSQMHLTMLLETANLASRNCTQPDALDYASRNWCSQMLCYRAASSELKYFPAASLVQTYRLTGVQERSPAYQGSSIKCFDVAKGHQGRFVGGSPNCCGPPRIRYNYSQAMSL